MLDKIRHSGPVEHLRRALRDKTMRAIDEVVSRHYREQTAQIEALRHRLDGLSAELRTEVGHAANRIIDHANQVEIRDRRDIWSAGEKAAAIEAAQFAKVHLASAKHFGHPHDTLEYGLSLAPQGGLALEFGVYSGTTLNIIAKARQGEQVYGFDSFQGLPEDWRASFPAGTFAVDQLPEVTGAELVVGWFADTLPDFLAEHPGPVDFLHLDADLYSATVTVFEQVESRLRPGSVIVFDEFFNYPDWQRHEYLAWQEFVARTGVKFSYEAFTVDNEQVVVRLLGEEGQA